MLTLCLMSDDATAVLVVLVARMVQQGGKELTGDERKKLQERCAREVFARPSPTSEEAEEIEEARDGELMALGSIYGEDSTSSSFQKVSVREYVIRFSISWSPRTAGTEGTVPPALSTLRCFIPKSSWYVPHPSLL